MFLFLALYKLFESTAHARPMDPHPWATIDQEVVAAGSQQQSIAINQSPGLEPGMGLIHNIDK